MNVSEQQLNLAMPFPDDVLRDDTVQPGTHTPSTALYHSAHRPTVLISHRTAWYPHTQHCTVPLSPQTYSANLTPYSLVPTNNLKCRHNFKCTNFIFIYIFLSEPGIAQSV